MKVRCLSVLVVLLLPGVLSAQTNTEVAPSYLQLSPSVPVNGMGEAGVALTESGSPFYNPACVAFVVENRWARFSGLPKRADLVPSLTNAPQLGRLAAVVRIPVSENSPMRLGIAYYRTNVIWKDRWVTFYDGHEFGRYYYDQTFTAHNVSLGASYSGSIDVGLGVTGKIVDRIPGALVGIGGDPILEFPIPRSTRFDFGLLLRKRLESYRWTVAPSMGVSMSNIGRETTIKMEHAAFGVFTISNDPPRTARIGLAVDIGLLDRPQKYRDWCLFTAKPTFEMEMLVNSDKPRNKLGLELGAAEALYVRAGAAGYVNDFDQRSWGITVNSRGIARLIGRLLGRDDAIGVSVFESRLQIEFDYAKYSEDNAGGSWLRGSEFYGISVSY